MRLNKNFVSRLPTLFRAYPQIEWAKALDNAQIESKLWLAQELKNAGLKDLGNVMILGGWVGLLGQILFECEYFKMDCVRSFDIDSKSIEVADLLNKEYETNGWRFKASFGDWDQLNYAMTTYQTMRLSDGSMADCETRFDTIINSCCEHMVNFEGWLKKIPQDRLLILQASSDKSQMDHVNCFESLNQLEDRARLSKVLYAGELGLSNAKRFMTIGFR